MLTAINRILGNFISYTYSLVFLLMIAEIIARYVFNKSLSASVEMALLLSALHYILSGPQATADNSHIAVDLLRNRLSPHMGRIVDTAYQVMGLVLFGFLTYWAFFQAKTSVSLFERTGSTLNSPLPLIVKCAILVALALMMLQSIRNLWILWSSSDDR